MTRDPRISPAPGDVFTKGRAFRAVQRIESAQGHHHVVYVCRNGAVQWCRLPNFRKWAEDAKVERRGNA
jgi:hypothetical protein